MAADRNTVTPEIVRRVAELARLRLPQDELALWTEQLGRIVSYIDQIEQIPESAFGKPAVPPSTPLRPDAPRPGNGRQSLERGAARLFEGFGVVPRVVGGGE